ncbi:uncharacterized protein F5891DRAFT_1198687 [Suillus fuscotomentosus]|uniref:Fungal-type protein kinase domain-containing protein n=1 Tax=Suillus fuscotomentosus TaxID=1912939 RepID=A0AAD4HDV3_9AGAM|nr:uncharacterized protein F5891DRAFT_1198687 [Suillus fuscotomentosus]KAG1889111.1 hypothetical protein F5891DRAFT_1198687 [Suillus fuscotomentosus]
MYDHSGGAVSTHFDIYQQPDLFSHIIAAINFGSLECVGYSPTVSFMKHVLPPLSMDIHLYRPINNIPTWRSSSADPDAFTSESLAELLVSESPSSDDHLESVVSDSEERSSEDSLEGSSNDMTTQSLAHKELLPSPSHMQPTMVSSAPLLGLVSQMSQDLTESICSVMPHPSQFPHSVYSPEPCGKIRVGDNIYIIKRILFTSWGLVGHGTICYLGSLNEEDYIVKDHWVLGKQDNIILNEIKMLKLIHGVPGILELVDYWLITTLAVQKTAVEEHKILHCDCSLNNVLILDNLDISKGFLIDWEFAVHITADNKYTIGGTGTVPFMSCRLLSQVALLQQQAKAEAENKKLSKTCKSKSKQTLKTPQTSSYSLALPVSHVIQGYSDDLESLFFTFTWVCIKFSGPNGAVHQERMSNSLLNRLTNLDLASSTAFKITFFANPLDEERLLNEFHPYFKPLLPLAKDWCAALKDNMVHPITFDTILHILNSHLDQLPDDEELQSTMAMLMKSSTILNSTPNLKCAASISLQPKGPGTLKQKKSDDI